MRSHLIFFVYHSDTMYSDSNTFSVSPNTVTPPPSRNIDPGSGTSKSYHRVPIAIGSTVGVFLLVVLTILVISKRRRREKYASQWQARQNCLDSEPDSQEQRIGESSLSNVTFAPQHHIDPQPHVGPRSDRLLVASPTSTRRNAHAH